MSSLPIEIVSVIGDYAGIDVKRALCIGPRKLMDTKDILADIPQIRPLTRYRYSIVYLPKRGYRIRYMVAYWWKKNMREIMYCFDESYHGGHDFSYEY